jgi:HK97 family phage major capsid protein
MDLKVFEKDMQDLIAKHGLKADGVEPTESKDVVGETPKDDTKVVADLASKVAEKLAGIISEKKDLADADTKNLNKELKTKIFTSWAGTKEISYPADLVNLSKEDKIVNFFKALVYSGHDPVSQQVLRALVEGTDSEGGYLVPEELRTEVFRVLPDLSVMRRIARTIPMSTDTLKLNSLSARPSAYWTAEYASKSTTSAEFSQITLNPHDLVCLLPVSEQLLADANINLVQFIIQLFAEAIAVAEDAAFFTGNGTGRPHGISTEAIASAACGGLMDFDDLIHLIDLIPQRSSQSPKAAFVGHRFVKRQARVLKDTANNYIWRDSSAGRMSGQTERLPDTLYGYPFYEQNDLAQSELYFGDWSNYIIGDRQTMTVKTTTEGGDAWRRNAMELKAVERVDGRAVILTPFAKLTGV